MCYDLIVAAATIGVCLKNLFWLRVDDAERLMTENQRTRRLRSLFEGFQQAALLTRVYDKLHSFCW